MFGLFKLRMGSADLATNSMAFFNKDKCTLDCLNLATRLENDYYNSRKGDINNLTSHSTALRFSIYYKKIRELNLFQESAFNLVDFKEKLINYSILCTIRIACNLTVFFTMRNRNHYWLTANL